MQYRSIARYGAVAQILHWATAIIVLIAFLYGPGGSEERIYAPARDFDRQLHETLGLCVLVLVVTRVIWRMFDTRPEPPPVARWMTVAARAVQAGLYLLLLALPFTAIAGAWLEGHPLTLLAGVNVPSALGASHAVGATIATIHAWLGDAIMWLAGVHALAGIYHHFFLKDDVLASMLPRLLISRNASHDACWAKIDGETESLHQPDVRR
jgi:cytochrome b561